MQPDPEPEHPTVERTGVVADDPRAPRSVTESRWPALAALTAVRCPALAPLVRVAPLSDGAALTHVVPAGSVTLAELREKGPFRAGHVLGVGLAVVGALVELAEAGLAHGVVSAEQVLVGPGGEVVLAGTGLAWARPPGSVGGPRETDDVAALGDLLRDLLGPGSAPSPLVLAALRASDPDPALRPSAEELRETLARCGRADHLRDRLWAPRPEPVERADLADEGPRTLRIDPRVEPVGVAVEPATSGAGYTDRADGAPMRRATPPRPAQDRRPRRSRPPRAGLLVVVSLAALALLGALRVGSRASADEQVLGRIPVGGSASAVTAEPQLNPPTMSSGAAQAGAAPAPTPSVSSGGAAGADLLLDRGADTPDWATVLAAIDDGRQRALAEGSVDGLRDVVAPDGAAWAADSALAARVSALHARIVGGALSVLEVRPSDTGAGRAALLVHDRRAAYTVVTSDGSREVPAREARWWRVTLVPSPSTSAGWRVLEVVAVAAPAP